MRIGEYDLLPRLPFDVSVWKTPVKKTSHLGRPYFHGGQGMGMVRGRLGNYEIEIHSHDVSSISANLRVGQEIYLHPPGKREPSVKYQIKSITDRGADGQSRPGVNIIYTKV